jgi:hypothetical protein
MSSLSMRFFNFGMAPFSAVCVQCRKKLDEYAGVMPAAVKGEEASTAEGTVSPEEQGATALAEAEQISSKALQEAAAPEEQFSLEALQGASVRIS